MRKPDMLPKKKASSIILSYLAILGNNRDLACECALVQIDMILEITCEKFYLIYGKENIVFDEYWLEVKKEIINFKNNH